jgi:hypothetical protein
MVRKVEDLRMAYLNTSSIHDNIVAWRKMLEIARNIVIQELRVGLCILQNKVMINPEYTRI